jgi:hypothetical protein
VGQADAQCRPTKCRRRVAQVDSEVQVDTHRQWHVRLQEDAVFADVEGGPPNALDGLVNRHLVLHEDGQPRLTPRRHVQQGLEALVPFETRRRAKNGIRAGDDEAEVARVEVARGNDDNRRRPGRRIRPHRRHELLRVRRARVDDQQVRPPGQQKRVGLGRGRRLPALHVLPPQDRAAQIGRKIGGREDHDGARSGFIRRRARRRPRLAGALHGKNRGRGHGVPPLMYASPSLIAHSPRAARDGDHARRIYGPAPAIRRAPPGGPPRSRCVEPER